MTTRSITRRDALRTFALGAGALAGAAACTTAPAGACVDGAGLAPSDTAVRGALSYMATSPYGAVQSCGTCSFYVAGAERAGCGSCTIVKGGVTAAGYCTGWRARKA